MGIVTCDRCRGTGWASVARDSGMENIPFTTQPIGVYRCPSCNGTGKIGFSDNIIELALALSKRRMRICKQAPCCPECKTQQVQIIDCEPLVTWKCRHCKHTWRYEPLVVQ